MLRLAGENPQWDYRRIHGELAALGVTIAASTAGEILKAEGVAPAPEHASTRWADVPRCPAHALRACDFIETTTLTGQRQYVLAAIEHATRRVRVLGTTAHPAAGWVAQLARNLLMDLDDRGATVTYLIRDRDAKFPELFDRVLADAGIRTILSGVRIPRMNSITERWVQELRHELLDRTPIWNQRHLLRALREFEDHHNRHRPHQAMDQPAPLQPVPEPATDPVRTARLDIRGHDRLGARSMPKTRWISVTSRTPLVPSLFCNWRSTSTTARTTSPPGKRRPMPRSSRRSRPSSPMPSWTCPAEAFIRGTISTSAASGPTPATSPSTTPNAQPTITSPGCVPATPDRARMVAVAREGRVGR